jgi:shikimate kinase
MSNAIDDNRDDDRPDDKDEIEALSPVPLGERSVVLVGLMGAGKTTVGRRLARRLDLAFVDTDAEIEKAAGETIPEIFERRGEATFRTGERRVIARLLGEGPCVLATGGGAFMDPLTRANIAARGISVWLKADLDVLMKRVGKRGDRPLLQSGDPRETMKRLMDERYPVYAGADITIESLEGPHDAVVEQVVEKLERFREEHADEAHAGVRE